jgi:hypothetical protein
MSDETGERNLTPFASATYDYIRHNLDHVRVDAIAGADFSTLLDLQRSVNALVEQGIEKWRNGQMP